MNTLITSTNLSRLISTAIFGVLTLSWGAMSIAADESDAPQAVVKFGDLNVSTSQGAVALYSRIHRAALDVCSRMYVIDGAYRWHKDACLQKVIADAVIKVNEPALSAVFASKYDVSPPVVLAAAKAR